MPSKNSPSTFERYENVYRNHIVGSEIAQLRVYEIVKITLQRFYNNQIKSGKSANTVYNINKVLKIFFRYAMDEGYILKNPCQKVELPKGTEKSECDSEMDEIQPFTREEIERIKNAIKGNDLEFLFLLSLGTGIRQGEALALTVTDLKDGLISINKSLSKVKQIKNDGTHEYVSIQGPPKTKSSYRDVPIPANLLQPLESYIAAQEAKYIKNGLKFADSSHIFTTESCNFIDRRNLLRAWARVLKKADVKYRGWHNIRHTYATLLFEADVPLKTVQVLLGHSSINMTAQIYTHVMPKQKESSVNKLNFIFQ